MRLAYEIEVERRGRWILDTPSPSAARIPTLREARVRLDALRRWRPELRFRIIKLARTVIR